MPLSLDFHPLLVLRSPSLPYTTPVSLAAVNGKLQDPFFREALYLASPDLYASATRPQAGVTTWPQQASLLNYLNRMRSRSTPFGLFAACSLVPWQGHPPLLLETRAHRHTRLDMAYVCSLAQALTRMPQLSEHLLYFPNSSYHLAGDQVRYLEYRYEKGQRIHQYSAVYASEALKTLLRSCRKGLSQSGLYALICDPSLPAAEIHTFIGDLIEAQVLVSELEPVLTGLPFSTRVLQVLTRIQAAHPDPELAALVAALSQVSQELQGLDACWPASPAAYEKISAMLPEVAKPQNQKKLFQVDLIRPLQAGGLPPGLRQDLLDFIPLFRKLAPVPENTRLNEFRQKFLARYEGQAKPLLEVLDPDIGIGYGRGATPGYQPLVEDLVLPAAAPGAATGTGQGPVSFLHRQVKEAGLRGGKEIRLAPQALAALPEPRVPLPPSLAVIFRLPEPRQILLEALSGPSAVNLISRFAPADAGFQHLSQSITAREETHNPGVIFAEILHLPEKRTGNILQRPQLRAYEIPYLAASALPADRQLPLQDLYLQVKENRLVLFSRTLNREIIPRLGTAHHFTADSLPVYLFLCDLQSQGLQAELSLPWHPDHYDTAYLPRLSCRNIILGLATWRLDRSSLASLLQADATQLPQAFRLFQQTWGLPDRFTFGEGDRELLIDARYPDTIRAWLQTIGQRPTLTLREYLFDDSQSLVQDAAGQAYAAQYIAPLINQSPVYTPAAPARLLPDTLPVAFPPGSEWLYYKLYGGTQTGETLLTEVLVPLIAELRTAGLIDQWFFLRYQDPEAHIRLRMHLPAPEKIGPVMALVYQYLQPYQQAGLLWKTEVSTYQRETGRYGAGAMLLAEQLFFADSQAVVDYLVQRPDTEAEDLRWIWGLRALDQLLTCFQYSLAEKLKLTGELKELFAREFKMDKTLKLAMDRKYRHYRPDLEQHFAIPGQQAPPYQSHSLALLESVASRLLALDRQGQLEVPVADLVPSFLHLHVNRLLPAQARLHELLLYDFLYRQYKTAWALQQKSALFLAPDDPLF